MPNLRFAKPVMFLFLCIPFVSFSQKLEVLNVEVINEPILDSTQGDDQPSEKFIVKLLIEVDGPLAELMNIDIKLNQFSKDLKSDQVILDRKLNYATKEDLPEGVLIQENGSIIFIDITQLDEPAFFKVKVTLEDMEGKKSKPVFYSPLKG